MKVLNSFLLLGVVCLFSCNKNSDNTTAEVADEYVGNYILTDTVSYVDVNTSQTVTEYKNSSANIVKVNAGKIASAQLLRYSCGQDTAAVTATSLVLITPCFNIDNLICTKSGNTLYYTYDANMGANYHIKGKAVKQ